MHRTSLYILITSFAVLPLLYREDNSSLHFDYFKTLINGITVFKSNLETEMTCILLFVIGWLISMIFMSSIDNKVKRGDGERLHILDIVSLGLSGTPIALTLICFIVITLGVWSILFFTLTGLTLLTLIRKQSITTKPKAMAGNARDNRIDIGLFLILSINLLLIKHGYIHELEFPLNIDSVNHTNLIYQSFKTESFLNLRFYHFAFHYIIVTLSGITQDTIPKTILVFGQLLQSIIPLTIFYPVHRITRSIKIALMTSFIAGVGFGLPSEATSWGKYSTLLVMSCLVYVLYIVNIWVTRGHLSDKQLLLIAGMIIAVIYIHTRALMLFLIGMLVFGLDRLIIRENKYISVMVTACTLLITVFISQANNHSIIGEWSLAWLPYTENKLLLGALLCLIPFSTAYFSKYSSIIFVFVMLTMMFVKIPAPKILADNYSAYTLIDRPFLSIFLFLPVCIMIGMGFSGMDVFLKQLGQYQTINYLMIILLIFILFLPNPKALRPLPTANLVTENDVLIYKEIEYSLPDQAIILIPNAPPTYTLGLDGGAWIEYVTGRHAIRMAYDTDFTSYKTHKYICAVGAQYVYAGNKPYSFSSIDIEQQTGKYELSISSFDVRLYQVVNCP